VRRHLQSVTLQIGVRGLGVRICEDLVDRPLPTRRPNLLGRRITYLH